MRERNAEAMMIENAAIEEMAKNMKIMMATMPGVNKPEVKNNIKTDTWKKEVKSWNKPG